MSVQSRIILWSAPRCTSTVFEHSIKQLHGVRTYHEVYTNAAYFGEERTFERYAHDPPAPNLKFSDVKASLETGVPDDQAVFCKEMAYSIVDRLEALPDGYEHSFLIRSPRKAITSMYRLAVSGDVPEWRHFDRRETGFDALWTLYEHVSKSMAHTPIVIESDELLSRPRDALRAYCEGVGLKFDETMLEWRAAGNHERLERWGGAWYQTLLGSSGFTRSASKPTEPLELPALIEAAIETAQPYYERLYARRLSF